MALEATNRWTDNIFSLQDWIKKKFPNISQVYNEKKKTQNYFSKDPVIHVCLGTHLHLLVIFQRNHKKTSETEMSGRIQGFINFPEVLKLT